MEPSMQGQLSGADQYRRKRRDALDRLVDRELRRVERCDRVQRVMAKAGLAILAGSVPALIAGLTGWIDRVVELVIGIFHGGASK